MTFERAQEDRYPNGLPFGGTDIISPSIVEQVFKTQSIDQYCPFSRFKGGLVVERGAAERRLLDAQYNALLSNARLSPVERQGLEDEYRARLEALPVEYRLIFVRPPGCDIPAEITAAVLSDILETWARESEQKRGVLHYDVSLAGPTILDETAPTTYLVARVDLVRTAIARTLDALDRISKLPGALALRSGQGTGMTLMELRGRLRDLSERVVEPLLVQAARAGARNGALTWLEAAEAQARIEKEAAQLRTEAYRSALREFSGTPQAVSTGAQAGTGSASPGQGDAQTTIAQLDGSFIERVIQLSSQSNEFRRELTQKMVDGAEQASLTGKQQAYYEMISDAARQTSGSLPAEAALLEQLDLAVVEGKRLVSALNSFYRELNTVGLHPGASMYVVTERTEEIVARPFSSRDFALSVIVTALLSLVLVPAVLLFTAKVQGVAERLSRR